MSLTLVDYVEAMLVLGVVAVEKESGLVGRAKEGVGHGGATEPINHRPHFQAPTANFQIVMNRLSGEVQKLEVDS